MSERVTVIDGLVISNWSREVFEDMRAGGVTAANCTCSVWEGFEGSAHEIAKWLRRIHQNRDLLTLVKTTADIMQAKNNGKTGIILGWQNLSGIEDQIDYLDLFYAVGLRVAQLTYNTRNLVGSGCWETVDGGLSDFGCAVIARMNELGILIDLSHVGEKTSRQALEVSACPPAYTHVAPRALKAHPRNKTDDELRSIIEVGGFVGYAAYPAFLPSGNNATFDELVDGFEYLINLCGEDAVGLGTDFTQGQPRSFYEYLRRDKGYGNFCVPGEITIPEMPYALHTLRDYPKLIQAMEYRNWLPSRIEKVMGSNWQHFLETVWR